MSGSEQSAGNAKSGDKGNGLSQASMKAMMSADSSMKQAQIQGNAATRMEGRAGVLIYNWCGDCARDRGDIYGSI